MSTTMCTYDGVYQFMRHSKRLMVISEFISGKITRATASLELDVSERTISRLKRRLLEKGPESLIHGNKGREPANKTPEKIKDYYIKTYTSEFEDCEFNFTHYYDTLVKQGRIVGKVAKSTVQRMLKASGIASKTKRRPSKARMQRAREEMFGQVLQLDGSPHEYLKGRKHCFISFIDDATSTILDAELFNSETTVNCLTLLRRIVERHGIPCEILTDNAGWSSGINKKRNHFSQFEEICKLLGIRLNTSSYPQDKGRIERSHRTHQDRLISELKYENINSVKLANEYLKKDYLVEWNKIRTVNPTKEASMFRLVPPEIDLDYVFTIKHKRICNNAHMINYDGKTYILLPDEGLNYKGKEIEVCSDLNGQIHFYSQGKRIDYSHKPLNKRKWLGKSS